jgi:hypothetical protein
MHSTYLELSLLSWSWIQRTLMIDNFNFIQISTKTVDYWYLIMALDTFNSLFSRSNFSFSVWRDLWTLCYMIGNRSKALISSILASSRSWSVWSLSSSLRILLPGGTNYKIASFSIYLICLLRLIYYLF